PREPGALKRHAHPSQPRSAVPVPSGSGRHREFPSLLIKKFIRRVLRFGSGSEPRTVPKGQHGIGREAISPGARKVCEVLHAQGHQAYVVGGAVRDLLLGLRPKDFDVATDAYPEEVHKLFRRSRLIGKRFKLVHVMFGEETVEVSTFRARTPAETDEHGRVLRDNIYGRSEEHTSELQSRRDLVCRLLLEKKKKKHGSRRTN